MESKLQIDHARPLFSIPQYRAVLHLPANKTRPAGQGIAWITKIAGRKTVAPDRYDNGLTRCDLHLPDRHGYGTIAGTAVGPLMFVVHAVGEIAKPCSLSMRLYGNIFGEDNVIEKLMHMGAGLPLQFPMLLFAIFTSFLQAFIFTALASIYIFTMTEHAEHEEGHHEESHVH